ncbi:hypothetical protein K9M06_03445, partial [Candidatus Bipolaricaulota bacterium]|nr:hypothetical protein [Candidatus Bipolaricaulota bacterium]
KVLLLLLTAGLVAGVALVSGNYYTKTIEPDVSEPPKAERVPDEGEIEDQPLQDKPEPEGEETDKDKEEVSLYNGPRTLDFKTDVTSEGESYTTRFRIRNVGTEKADIRIDTVRGDGAEMTIILRGSANEGWIKDYSSNSWTHFTGFAFTQWWKRRSDQYLAYKVEDWEEMEGKEFTVENEEGSGRVYDIVVNSNIPDSVFTEG